MSIADCWIEIARLPGDLNHAITNPNHKSSITIDQSAIRNSRLIRNSQFAICNAFLQSLDGKSRERFGVGGAQLTVDGERRDPVDERPDDARGLREIGG